MPFYSALYVKPVSYKLNAIRIFLLGWILLTADVSANTIWLKNGDTITGEIKSLQDNRLGVVTDYAGLIYLQWDKIESLDGDHELKIDDKQLNKEYLALNINTKHSLALMSDEKPSEATEDATKTVSIWDKSNWQGGLDLNLNQKIASSKTEYYSAKINTKLRYGDWQHKLDANYRRKIDDSKTKTHEYGANFSSDRFITDNFFWQGRAMYKRDHIEDVTRQTAIGTGPGYQFWDDDSGTFSLSGLLGRTRYDYSDETHEGFYSANLRWDYNRYLMAKDIELYTKGGLTRPLNNATDFSLDASIGMRYHMTKWLSWFMEHSRNLISGGRQDMDERRISTGLGLMW